MGAGHEADDRWTRLIVPAAAVAGLVILLRVLGVVADGGSGGEVVGRALGVTIGTLFLPLVIGLAIGRRHPRAGVLGFTLGVVIVGVVVSVGRSADFPIEVSDETRSQIEAVGEIDVSPDEAACVDGELEGAVTLDELVNDPDADEARQRFIQAALDCEGVDANSTMLADSVARNIELGLDGLYEIDREDGGCIVDYVVANGTDPARTLAVGDQPEDGELFLAAAERCLDGEILAYWRGDVGTGPQVYGDSVRLDGLVDECGDGDDRACDLLYAWSSLGSEYADFADRCGGRGYYEGAVLCTAGIEIDESGFADPTTPTFTGLMADCEAGDPTACDLVYVLAPLGSAEERVGFTCGGRVPMGALPDCRARFD